MSRYCSFCDDSLYAKRSSLNQQYLICKCEALCKKIVLYVVLKIRIISLHVLITVSCLFISVWINAFTIDSNVLEIINFCGSRSSQLMGLS